MTIEHVYFWHWPEREPTQVAELLAAEFGGICVHAGRSSVVTREQGWTAVHSTPQGVRLHVHDDDLAAVLLDTGRVKLPELLSREADGEQHRLAIEHLLCHQRSHHQTLTIAETLAWDTALFLDGELQSASGDEDLYHQALVLPAMNAHPHPRRVFICGAGEGASTREVLRFNTVEQVMVIDIDAELMARTHEHLAVMHNGALMDPRVRLVTSDVAAFVEGSCPWDVVIFDLSDPVEGSPAASAFNVELFRALASQMGPGGVVASQAGEWGSTDGLFNRVRAMFREVFPDHSAYTTPVPSFGAEWAFMVSHPPREWSPLLTLVDDPERHGLKPKHAHANPGTRARTQR